MSPSSSFWIDLGNHLWQATLFGLFIASLVYLMKGIPARIRFYLGWVGLLKFILPSALFLLLLGDGVQTALISNSLITESILPIGSKITEPLFLFKSPDSIPIENRYAYGNTLILLGAIWAAGSLAFFIFWQIKVHQLHKLIRENAEPVSASLNAKIDALKDTLGLRCHVSALLVKKNIEPGVFGIIRPHLILTRELLEEFTQEEFDTILIHELIHIKHRDNLWAHLQVIILCLFWFHPLVWWLIRYITNECENACDEEVIKYTGNNKVYAKAIFKVSQLYTGLRVYGFSGISSARLKDRIQSILDFKKSGFSMGLYRSVIAAVLILLGISIILGGLTPDSVKLPTKTTSFIEGRGLTMEPKPGANEAGVKNTLGRLSTASESANENGNIIRAFNKMNEEPLPQTVYLELGNYLRNLDYERDKINRAINDLKNLNHINPSYETIDVERARVGTIIDVLVKYEDYTYYPKVRKSFERVQFAVVERQSGKYKDLEQITFAYNIESRSKPQVRRSYYGDNIWIGSSIIYFKNKTAKRKIESLILALDELDVKEREKFQELRSAQELSTNS